MAHDGLNTASGYYCDDCGFDLFLDKINYFNFLALVTMLDAKN